MPLGGMGRTGAFGKAVASDGACAIKATPASALPTATCGYVGDPKGGGTAPSAKRLTKNPALKAPDTGH